MIKVGGVLLSFSNVNLGLSPEKIWGGVAEIGENAFAGCSRLQSIKALQFQLV